MDNLMVLGFVGGFGWRVVFVGFECYFESSLGLLLKTRMVVPFDAYLRKAEYETDLHYMDKMSRVC